MKPQPLKQKTYNRIYVAWKQLKEGNPLKEKLEIQLNRLKHEIEGKSVIVCACCPVFGCTFCDYIHECGLVSENEQNLVLEIHRQMPYKTWQEIPRHNSKEYYQFVLNLRHKGENEWITKSSSKMVTA